MKSGETDTSVLAAIRERICDIEINTKAEKNVMDSAKRKKSNGEFSIVFTEDKPKEFWINNRVQQYKNDCDKSTFFPDYWLAFCLLGAPCDIEGVRCFSIEAKTVIPINVCSNDTTSDAISSLGRDARRKLENNKRKNKKQPP